MRVSPICPQYAGLDDSCYYWIGLYDAIHEGRFIWVDGTELNPADAKWLKPGM